MRLFSKQQLIVFLLISDRNKNNDLFIPDKAIKEIPSCFTSKQCLAVEQDR